MKSLRSRITALFLVCATAAATLAASLAFAQPAPSAAIDVRYGEWTDTARAGRVVPYKLYLPMRAGPAPVVIHSHGLGGSREASAYILEAVADAGFVVVALQHAGSDSGLLTAGSPGSGESGALAARRAGMTSEAARGRYGDVPFALDQLAAANRAGGMLAGRLDLSHIGMSGHSYGALSTLVASGQRVLGARAGEQFSEPRIIAAIAYSPNRPRGDDARAALAAVKTPMLHFTGTADRTPFDVEKTPFERTTPFQAITGPDQFLIILTDADHALFGGRRVATDRVKPTDRPQMQIVKAETIRFWRAYLGGDRAAFRSMCDLPTRMAGAGEGFTKAERCGRPTPIAPVDGLR